MASGPDTRDHAPEGARPPIGGASEKPTEAGTAAGQVPPSAGTAEPGLSRADGRDLPRFLRFRGSGGPAAHPFLTRYGVLMAMLATFVAFSLISPHAFFTALTLKGILRDAAPLMIMALGVTAVLVMNNYDLSVGGSASLCATAVILLLSTAHVGLNYIVAIVLTLAIGAGLGLFNGFFIAYLGAPSFIFTIAMGTVYTGAGLQLTKSNSVYSGISQSYVNIASGTTLGFSNMVFIGLGVLVVTHIFFRYSEAGRYMYAIGGNPEAARLSGVPVRALTTLGFAIAGVGAAIAGILLTSEAAAVNPETGTGLLLPAYAAAFLGASMFRVGVFTPIGTALGALFLQIIGTGLTILNLSGPVVQIIQGGILAAAVMVARINRQARAS